MPTFPIVLNMPLFTTRLVQNKSFFNMVSVDHAFLKAYTCYRLTGVAVILVVVNHELSLSLLNAFFQSNL